MFKIQYPERALWLYHQNIHKHTLILLWSPGFHWIITLASTPTPTDTSKRQFWAFYVHYFNVYWYFCNFSGGRYLCQMLWLVSAVILASQHQPMLLIPFVNASYCVQEPVRMLYPTKDTQAGKSYLKWNHHGNNSLLWQHLWHGWITTALIFSHKIIKHI